MELVVTTTTMLKGKPEDLVDFIADMDDLERELEEPVDLAVVACGCEGVECLEEIELDPADAELYELLDLKVIADRCLFGPPEGYDIVQSREDYTLIRVAPAETVTEVPEEPIAVAEAPAVADEPEAVTEEALEVVAEPVVTDEVPAAETLEEPTAVTEVPAETEAVLA